MNLGQARSLLYYCKKSWAGGWNYVVAVPSLRSKVFAATSYVLRVEICELKEAGMMQSAENEAGRVRSIAGVADVYQKAGDTSLRKPKQKRRLIFPAAGA